MNQQIIYILLDSGKWLTRLSQHRGRGLGLYFYFHTTVTRKAVQRTKKIIQNIKKIEDIKGEKEKGKRG